MGQEFHDSQLLVNQGEHLHFGFQMWNKFCFEIVNISWKYVRDLRIRYELRL